MWLIKMCLFAKVALGIHQRDVYGKYKCMPDLYEFLPQKSVQYFPENIKKTNFFP